MGSNDRSLLRFSFSLSGVPGWGAAIALACLLGCSESTGGGQNTPSSISEVDYALTAEADGLVDFVDTLPTCFTPGGATALVLNGQPTVYWPISPGTLSPAVEDFIRYHELGHHYADHLRTSIVGFFSEYEADGYATRVLYELSGPMAVEEAIDYVEVFAIGNATHRTGAMRASYMEDVLAALETGNPSPPPPVGADPPETIGQLDVVNEVYTLAQLVIDGTAESTSVPFGDCRSRLLDPGTVTIEWNELDPGNGQPTGATTQTTATIVVGEITTQ